MMKKQNNNLKLAIFWIISFICIIFLMSLRSYASEPYFPMEQNANNLFTDGMISALDTQFDTENNYVFIYTYSFAYGEYYGYSCYIAKGSATAPYLFGEINNDGNAFSLYPLQGYSLMKFSINPTTNVIRTYPTAGTNSNNYINLPSSSYNSNYDYISNFRLYTSNSDDAAVVLKYGHEPNPPIDVGTAIIPPSPFIPEYLTGDYAPQNVPPEYTINNYTWTTAPQFDGSTVINGIQSIKNTLDWISSNLHEELANLLNNIKGLATYIGKTIQYYGNAIIETINNAIQNFYDNMKALVEPIYTKLENFYNDFLEFADLFIHPFDEEEFESQIENCQLISQYNELMDNADDIRAIFNNAEERDYFVLYIDFENPFADSEHKIIHSEISFTWLKNYRSSYRPFLWLFTMIECFVGGMRLLGGIIGGKAK